MKKSDCRGCNENLTPAEWWHDLSLRLNKAVHCLTPYGKAAPPENAGRAINVFTTSALDAENISKQLAEVESEYTPKSKTAQRFLRRVLRRWQ